MEQSIWQRLKSLIQESMGAKFKAFIPGVCMGFIGSEHLLWNGEIVTVVIYVLKSVLTVIMAFCSGLATAYAALIVENYKNKRNVKSSKKKGKSDNKAA